MRAGLMWVVADCSVRTISQVVARMASIAMAMTRRPRWVGRRRLVAVMAVPFGWADLGLVGIAVDLDKVQRAPWRGMGHPPDGRLIAESRGTLSRYATGRAAVSGRRRWVS